MAGEVRLLTGILLAGGASRRFGESKLLLPVAGRPLVRLVVEQVLASGLDAVVVVLGREAEAVKGALRGLPVEFVENPDYEQGMSTSLRCGVTALEPATEAAVVALADQPLPSASVIDRLVQAFRVSSGPIVVPVYAGQRGNPVLFAGSVFAELMQVTGDEGARGIIARDPGRVETVDFPFPPPPDVDTPADYERLLREHEFLD